MSATICFEQSYTESGNISVDELLSAESVLIKHVQFQCYPLEIKYFCGKTKSIPNLVRQLRLQFVAGILRCGGRFQSSQLSYSSKYPILLPTKSHFTELIIYHVHKKCFQYLTATVATLREQWWIPCARQRVRSVLRKCVICSRLQTHPYPAPETAPLPYYRVSEAKPFSICGVDYTGTVSIKRGQLLIKAYTGCLRII